MDTHLQKGFRPLNVHTLRYVKMENVWAKVWFWKGGKERKRGPPERNDLTFFWRSREQGRISHKWRALSSRWQNHKSSRSSLIEFSALWV